MRLLIAVVITLLTACCVSVPDQAARSRPEVLRLDLPNRSVCTGTAIGPHAVLTAAHCLAGATAGVIGINGERSGFVVAANDGHDHVILTTALRYTRWAGFAPVPPPGSIVYLWGNPAGLDGVLRVGRIAGEVQRVDCIGRPPGPCTMLLIDSNNAPGDSGAAIFDTRGRIVAVNTGGLDYRGWSMPFAYHLRFTPEQLAAALL